MATNGLFLLLDLATFGSESLAALLDKSIFSLLTSTLGQQVDGEERHDDLHEAHDDEGHIEAAEAVDEAADRGPAELGKVHRCSGQGEDLAHRVLELDRGEGEGGRDDHGVARGVDHPDQDGQGHELPARGEELEEPKNKIW